MLFGFQSRFVECVCNQDGRNWELLKPIEYIRRDGRKFIIPRGASTDGASTPAIIFSLFPPTGAYWQAAILHDSCYCDSLLNPDGTKATLTKDKCDLLLKEAMELSGVDNVSAEIIYQSVDKFGQHAFNANRS